MSQEMLEKTSKADFFTKVQRTPKHVLAGFWQLLWKLICRHSSVLDSKLRMFHKTCAISTWTLTKERNALHLFRKLRKMNLFFQTHSFASARVAHLTFLSEIARKKIFFICESGKGNSKEMSHLSKKLMRRIRHQKFSRQKWRCVKNFWPFWHTNQNPEWFRLCLFPWKYSQVSVTLILWPN